MVKVALKELLAECSLMKNVPTKLKLPAQPVVR